MRSPIKRCVMGSLPRSWTCRGILRAMYQGKKPNLHSKLSKTVWTISGYTNLL